MSTIAEPVQLAEDFHVFSADPSEVRFSYSKPEDPLWKRIIIRGIERLTGQPRLERLYRAWSAAPVPGENLFAAAMRLMQVRVACDEAALAAAPKTGPLLIIANHPFGVMDGLALMHMATRIRPDVKIMVHALLCQPPELKDYLLPVDFSGTAEARATSAATRRRTVDWLARGHCVVIFPAGGVSTAQSPWRGRAVDSAWHEFVARLARAPGLKILPVFFEGQNSRAFHMASHVNYSLRIALLFRESVRRMGGKISAQVGAVIDASALPHAQGKKAVMQDLRRATYALGGQDGSAEFVWPSHIKVD
ncbi:MAG: lysophospholipid acyltransferase family protein [Alphaproteobacteria bacterium]|nr:lysophospholipid acyltransferase family protein [Alphaproteobacteria bacterium]